MMLFRGFPGGRFRILSRHDLLLDGPELAVDAVEVTDDQIVSGGPSGEAPQQKNDSQPGPRMEAFIAGSLHQTSKIVR